MGSLFGGMLVEAGHEVVLVARNRAHVEAVSSEGLQVTGVDGTERWIDVPVTAEPAEAGPADLLLVFVKSYDTAAAMAGADPLLASDPDVLTLQNGLGNAETIAEHVPEERVLAGTTAHGSIFVGPGHVRHTGVGSTVLGRYFVPNDRAVERVAGVFSEAGIRTEAIEAVPDAVWAKVLVNVGINAATGLARVHNGAMTDSEPGRRLLRRAVREAARVARAEGRDVGDDPVAETRAVAEATADNRSSMWQDLSTASRTEVDYINGAVVDLGERHGIDVPVNRTLTDLVRLAETGRE